MSIFSHPAEASTKLKNYSGEEIFKGVILGQGELAYRFPELWTDELIQHSNTKENLKYTDMILKEMDKEDSRYFKDLHDAVYSKDHLRTQKLFKQGGMQFMTISKKFEEGKGSKQEIEQGTAYQDTTKQANGFGAIVVSVFTMVALLTHAVGVTFYLEAAAAGPGLSVAQNDLQNEEMVNKTIELVTQ